MRTTIDLDERVLSLGRAKANREKTSLGRAISDLVLDGLGQPATLPEGFPVFTAQPGHVITDELVAQYKDE